MMTRGRVAWNQFRRVSTAVQTAFLLGFLTCVPNESVARGMDEVEEARVREKRALAFLKKHGTLVSPEALVDAAMNAEADVVEALLDAGVSVDPEGVGISPIEAAATVGCIEGKSRLEDLVRIMELLVAHGADVEGKDELGNTLLMRSAPACPLSIIQKLVELGADANPKPNAQDVTPLVMALVSGKWDVAEFLVERGARLKPAQVDSMFFEKPSDPRVLAILERAQKPEAVR